MEQVLDGEIAYLDLTELDNEERRWLFVRLWANNAGSCGTCSAMEGECQNSTCIRTRVTNKLHLSEEIY